MRIKIAIPILIAGTLSIPTHAPAGENYTCVAEQATGFAYDETSGSWNRIQFRPNESYRVGPDETKEGVWQVTRIGDKTPVTLCVGRFDGAGYLDCDGAMSFRMSRRDLRFVAAYLAGYAGSSLENDAGSREGGQTPYLQIGTCTRR